MQILGSKPGFLELRWLRCFGRLRPCGQRCDSDRIGNGFVSGDGLGVEFEVVRFGGFEVDAHFAVDELVVEDEGVLQVR